MLNQASPPGGNILSERTLLTHGYAASTRGYSFALGRRLVLFFVVEECSIVGRGR